MNTEEIKNDSPQGEKSLENRTLTNFFDNQGNNRNWELNLIDPTELENTNRKCFEHPKDEVYLNIKEWSSEYNRHWFVGDQFKNKDYCYDCSRNKLESLYNNETLAKYYRDKEGNIKVSKLTYSDERARLTHPFIKKILGKKSEYLKALKSQRNF